MNKILRKTVDELEKIKNIGVSEDGTTYKFRDSYIEDMITVLKTEVEPDFPIMIDFYKDLEAILGYCDLSSYERGYVVTKILENNLLLVKSRPYSYMRPELYRDSFKKAGIELAEVPKLYQDFLDTGKVDAESIIYIKHCQKLLDITFFPDQETDKKMAILCSKLHLKFPQKVARDVLIGYFSKMTTFDYEALVNSAVHFKFYKRILDGLGYLGCPSDEVSKKLFINYLMDKKLTLFKEEISNNILDTFREIQVPEEKYRLTEVSFYLKVKKYLDNPNKTSQDCLEFKSVLGEKVSESLCDDVLYYLDVKNSKKVNSKVPEINILYPKKTEEVLPKVSKKKLKNDLKLLYNEETIGETGFDFKNYKRLLELLKALNYADSVNQAIFSRVYCFAQKNDDYYSILYERARVLGKSSIVDEILEIEELLKEIPPRERPMWQDQLDLLKAAITPLYEKDFDYEFKLMKEMK